MQIRAPSRLTPLPLLLLLLLPLVLLLVRFPGRAAGLPVVFRSYIRTPWNRTQDECLLPDIIIKILLIIEPGTWYESIYVLLWTEKWNRF